MSYNTVVNERARRTLSFLGHSSNLKSIILDTDEFIGIDSVNSNTLIRISSNSVYNYLRPKFDERYYIFNIVNIVNDYTLQLDDSIILASGNTVLTLPNPILFSGQYTIKNINHSNANSIILYAGSYENVSIDFNTSNTVINVPLKAIRLVSNGTSWFIV